MEIGDRARALLSDDDAEWLAYMASIEAVVMAACEDRLAAFCRQAIPEAYAAYEAIQQPAWAAYRAIEQQAYEAYEAIRQPALAAYEAIQQPAYAAYLAIQHPALAAYGAIQHPALAAYKAVQQQARRDIILPAIMEWSRHE